MTIIIAIISVLLELIMDECVTLDVVVNGSNDLHPQCLHTIASFRIISLHSGHFLEFLDGSKNKIIIEINGEITAASKNHPNTFLPRLEAKTATAIAKRNQRIKIIINPFS